MITTFVLATFLLTTQPKTPTTVSEYHGTPRQIIKPLKPHSFHIPAQQPKVVIDTLEPVEQPLEAPESSGTTNCGDNQYKQFIYQHESGCNTASTNAGGCFGIGQDCNNIVKNQCGTDFACQDRYFSNYAVSRYGSWAAAYGFWLGAHWW